MEGLTKKIDLMSRTQYEKGCMLKQAGRLSEAVTAFTEAIDRHTGFAEAHFKRGVCYYLLGNCHMAALDLEAAGLLGCREALLWSRYDIQQMDDSIEN